MSIDLNQHWRKYNPTIHLGGADLEVNGKPQDWIVTIKHIQLEKVGDEGQNKPILYFEEQITEKNKGMICGAKVSKAIEEVYKTPILSEWIGKKIQIFGVHEKNFGKIEYVVRVRKVIPVIEKPELTPSHPKWNEAIQALKEGRTTLEAIAKRYTLSVENEATLSEVTNA